MKIINNFSPDLTPAHDTLTFRLYINIKFSKPVGDNDRPSIGSFTFDFHRRPVQFDFGESIGSKDQEDRSVIKYILKNPDYDTFPEIMILTKEMLKNVTGITEIITDIEEGNSDVNEGNKNDCLHPVEVVEAAFVVINDSSNEEALEEIRIPILTGWKFPY